MRVSFISDYQQLKSFNSYKKKENSYFTPLLTYDVFFKQNSISFRSEYNKPDAINFVLQIEQGKVNNSGQGYQSAFYKINDDIGIKAPQPMYPNLPSSDKFGENNHKEFLVLSKVKEINPAIAVKPIDLIESNDKAYLVMDVIKGVHPFEAGLTQQSLDDIIQKCCELDINGIAHCDLQNGNIFITQDNKAKFIDFASNCILLNDGSYIASDDLPVKLFVEYLRDKTNSSIEGKFLATFYTNQYLADLKNNSDNRNLKIISNISNLEYRLIYEYLKQDKEQKPKEFLINYLKSKSKNYHNNMLEFLETLKVSPNDIPQTEQMKNAIEAEKIYAEIFSNPTENVLKAELGKMQLKWLINDNQGDLNKAYNYYQYLIDSIDEQIKTAEGSEKKYYKQMQETLKPYKELLDNSKYKGSELEDSKNLVKKIFEKTPIEPKPPVRGSGQSSSAGINKKIVVILSIITALAGGAYLYNKNKQNKNQNENK